MRKSSTKSAIAYSTAGVLFALLATTAQAQIAADTPGHPGADSPQPDSGIDASDNGEIVVTATRTASAVSRVPLSISAYNQASLDRTGVRDVQGIVRQTPGLVFQATRNSTNISIRGINSTAGAATTGIYIDDTPIQIRSLGYGGGNTYPAVFDLERVEVLRGPQGTLFGAGSEGGTVRFITPKPNLSRYTGYGRAELGFTENGGASYEVGAALGGPIVKDKIGFRASGYYRRDGGWVDRRDFRTLELVEGHENWSDSYSGRIAITFQPSERLTITPSIFAQKVYVNGSSYQWLQLSDVDNGQYVNGNPAQEWNRDRFFLPALNVEYNFDGVDLIAIGSYFDRRQSNILDYTTFAQSLFTGISLPTLPGQVGTSFFRNSQKNYTLEGRLQSSDNNARLRWVIGGFWSRAKQQAIQQVEDLFFPTYIQNAFGVPYTQVFGQPLYRGRFLYDGIANTKDKQYAIFGEVNWRILEKLTLTVGLRYGKTDFDINADTRGPVVGPPAIDSGGQSEKPLTPKFGLSYQMDANNLFYATVAKGFRPGGYNPSVGTPCGPQLGGLGLTDRPALYQSDSVWSYEVGAKNKFLNNRVQIAASAYQINWNDIQQTVALSTCGFAFTSNLGSVRSRGFDLQAQVNPVDNLQLSAAIGYTNARFRQTVFGGPAATAAIVSAGDAVVGPPWTISLHAEYNTEIFGGRDGYIRADYDYRSHQQAITPTLNPANGGRDLTIPNVPAVHLLGVRAGVRWEGIDASIFVSNLLGEDAWVGRQRDNTRQTLYREQLVRPRTFGATASYRF